MAKQSLSFFIGIRYVIQRKSSRSISFMSGIAILGLVVAVTLLILVLSVMNGFKKVLEEKILGIMPEVSVYGPEAIDAWQDLAKTFKHPSIVASAPFIDLKGMLVRSLKVQPLLIRGVDFEKESAVSIINQYIDEPIRQELTEQVNTLLLGKGVADRLGVDIGGQLRLLLPSKTDPRAAPKVVSVRVVGLLETKTELDQAFGLVSLETAQEINGEQAVTGIRLKLDKLSNAYEVTNYLRRLLPFHRVTNWQLTHGHLYEAIAMSKKMVGLLLVLIIAIAAFNVVSTLVMVVVDKQAAIAILRTLGASQKTIMGIFMVQGAMVGLIGTTIGALLGLMLAYFIGDIIEFIEALFSIQLLDASIYPVSFIPSQILMSDVLKIVGASLAMSFLATLYPAWKASRVKPAEVLRYE